MPATKIVLTWRPVLLGLVAILSNLETRGQQNAAFADSVRRQSNIPELCYAVMSSDSIFEIRALGNRIANSASTADVNDLFRLGSNTKAITGLLAATLVNQGKLQWNTRFFELFPELKPASHPSYEGLTLLDLLTFRTRLSHYTYTDKQPSPATITGTDAEQRLKFMKWVLAQKPVGGHDSVNFSNPGYVLAGAMLERATGKSYEELITDFGKSNGITFHFGQPNNIDAAQPWGHNALKKPEPPGENRKLNWLLPAGNITLSAPEFAKLLQMMLKGAAGKSPLLTAEQFNFLLFGRTQFSVGWFPVTEKGQAPYAYNKGNPGTFLSYTYIYPSGNLAIFILSNIQSDEAENGMDLLLERLKTAYLH